MHSAFGLKIGNKHYSLGDKSRDVKRAAMKNLVMVIVDEISMVTPDLLIMLDLRLQEIKEKVGVPFGGVSVLVFGDLMQLRPIQGKFIFEAPSNPEFQTGDALDPRWKKFRSVLFEENHRQGKQKNFAAILNRIRTGDQNGEDLNELRKRVRSENHEDVKKASVYICCKRVDVAKVNNKYLAKFKTEMFLLHAKHHHPTMKNFKPQIDKRDKVVAKTGLIDIIWVRIGVKVMIVRNIDVPDMLVNGQIGTLKEVILTMRKDKKEVEILVIELDNQRAGKENQKNNLQLSQKYPNCIFIRRMQFNYTIGRKKGDIGSSALVIQFPIRVCYAVSAHKIQGGTFEEPATVAMDLRSVFEPAQAYVMLSRVQAIEQLIIVENLPPEKIYASERALEEIRRLENISLNRNPGPWDQSNNRVLKIASLNCAGYVAHKEDLNVDEKILKSHIIHLLETSIPEHFDVGGLQLPGKRGEFINVGRGKGITTFIDQDIIYDTRSEKNEDLQIIKVKLYDIDLISLYRSNGKSHTETLYSLMNMIDHSRPTLITGDFNICLLKHPKNIITKTLTEYNFKQLMKGATHLLGGQIDQAYWKDPTSKMEEPRIETYCPYYSDHDAVLISLQR